ncbi:hypothetical protein SAMN02745121_05993 [Nannocystis exedens]|uniref:Uncharacterized protein n=1 Tax=Nannocystis exedens TaxID=54 RepID=A0A1I2EBY6_9BACT|nr:hypothetical protein [Nannocystis exedens]PCC74828.1 hypothetical protein NAEX_07928 [Nannocystis exedens]SFE90177.1 hypothetical protein SAMN02745121_05993 [Nannocystis exedens]
MRVELRADDGTDDHFPADSVLAQTAVLEHRIEQPEFPLVEFAEPAWLDVDQLYHIVYVQLGEPGNEVSINDLHNLTYGSPKSPFFDDDFATLICRENTGWSRRARYIPLFELHYDDGVVKGQGNLAGAPWSTRSRAP